MIWVGSLRGNTLLAQNNYPVNVLEKILFNGLRKRREKLDPHTGSLIDAFFPVPDYECGNLNFMLIPGGKYQIHMSTYRSGRGSINEHTIH